MGLVDCGDVMGRAAMPAVAGYRSCLHHHQPVSKQFSMHVKSTLLCPALSTVGSIDGYRATPDHTCFLTDSQDHAAALVHKKSPGIGRHGL
jgi:hypothetical protein